jgi:hypothetical protein
MKAIFKHHIMAVESVKQAGLAISSIDFVAKSLEFVH